MASLAVCACNLFQPTSDQAGSGGVSPSNSPGTVLLASPNGWKLTSAGLLHVANDHGSWQSIDTLPAINYVWGTVASFATRQVAWLCEQGRAIGLNETGPGALATGTSPPARCFATGDGGVHWTDHDVPSTGTTIAGSWRYDTTVDEVVAVSGREAWAAVSTLDTFAGGGEESEAETDVRIEHTLDAGAHWVVSREVQSSDDTTSVNADGEDWVTLLPQGVLAGGVSDGVAESMSDGASWSTLSVPMPPGSSDTTSLCGAHQQGSQLVVAFQTFVQSSEQVSYEVTDDGGSHWKTWTGPPPGQSAPYEYPSRC